MGSFKQLLGTTGSTTNVTLLALTPGANTTVGNTLIGIVKLSGGNQVSSVTDTQSNIWVVDVHSPSSGPTISIIRTVLATALTTSDSITANFVSQNDVTLTVAEYNGNFSTVDVTANGNSASNVATGSIVASTPTAGSIDLVVSGLGTGGSSPYTSASIYSSTPPLAVRSQGWPTLMNAGLADGNADTIVTPAVAWAWTGNLSTWGMAIAAYTLNPVNFMSASTPMVIR